MRAGNRTGNFSEKFLDGMRGRRRRRGGLRGPPGLDSQAAIWIPSAGPVMQVSRNVDWHRNCIGKVARSRERSYIWSGRGAPSPSSKSPAPLAPPALPSTPSTPSRHPHSITPMKRPDASPAPRSTCSPTLYIPCPFPVQAAALRVPLCHQSHAFRLQCNINKPILHCYLYCSVTLLQVLHCSITL